MRLGNLSLLRSHGARLVQHDAVAVERVRDGFTNLGRRVNHEDLDARRSVAQPDPRSDDADLGALIAYLRTLPDKGGSDTLPATSLRLLARVGVITGKYNLEPVEIVHDAPRAPNGPDAAARGQYLAKSTCTECHGQRLEGSEETPALSIVAGYSPAEFARLMREGVPRDGRRLEMMGGVARARFVHFSDEEVGALYAYLSTQMTASKN